MKETWEMRVRHNNAPESECIAKGRRSGHITRLSLNRNDPCLDELLTLHVARLAAGETGLISYSEIKRDYTTAEVAAAQLFQIHWTKMFEPAGEESGTQYLENGVCPVCGAGRVVSGRLKLSAQSLPAGCDAAFTIARDERVVNQRLADIIEAEGFSGVELREVETSRPTRDGSRWYQLIVTGPRLMFATKARFANAPIDERNEYACPLGDTLGNTLVSEAHVQSPTKSATDVMESLQYQGWANGVVVPWSTIFVSPRFRAEMVKRKVLGWKYDVAYYDDVSR